MKIEKDLKKLIEEIGGEDFQKKVQVCYQCGTCVGGCPVAWVNENFNPRKIILALSRGEIKDIITNDLLWFCCYCHTCLERCPQKILVSEIIAKLKNIAAKVRDIPEGYINELKMIAKTGRTSSVSSASERRRDILNLPKISQVSVEKEINKILEETGSNLFLEKE
ncbi:MAG: 4Fe-4S dicluster domain-containing protein [Actinobacteria bacterium]|nr:4Fe-4S dicluster domain-containing protein [Actinomycetota bacterium]